MLVIVKIGYEASYSALVVIFVLYRLLASVIAKNYSYTAVEECLLTHTRGEYLIIEYRLLKDGLVGHKGYLYSVRLLGTFTLFLKGSYHLTSFESFGKSFSLV